MGKVLWHTTMSLDGFMAGRGDDMQWVRDYAGPNPLVREVIEKIGAIVVGRRTYEVEDRERGGFYGGAWSGPFFVVTHVPPADPPEWMTGTFVTGGVLDAVARAKEAAGEDDVAVFGASTARQCVEAGVLDEILVHVAPVLLGDGVRLFDRAGADLVRLEPTHVSEAGPVTNLRFAVVRDS